MNEGEGDGEECPLTGGGSMTPEEGDHVLISIGGGEPIQHRGQDVSG